MASRMPAPTNPPTAAWPREGARDDERDRCPGSVAAFDDEDERRSPAT